MKRFLLKLLLLFFFTTTIIYSDNNLPTFNEMWNNLTEKEKTFFSIGVVAGVNSMAVSDYYIDYKYPQFGLNLYTSSGTYKETPLTKFKIEMSKITIDLFIKYLEIILLKDQYEVEKSKEAVYKALVMYWEDNIP